MTTESLRALCTEAGVHFEGIFQSFVCRNGDVHLAQLLWTSCRTKSSYCLPIDESLSVAAIVEHTEIMDANFSGAETVCLTHAAGRTYRVENF